MAFQFIDLSGSPRAKSPADEFLARSHVAKAARRRERRNNNVPITQDEEWPSRNAYDRDSDQDALDRRVLAEVSRRKSPPPWSILSCATGLSDILSFSDGPEVHHIHHFKPLIMTRAVMEHADLQPSCHLPRSYGLHPGRYSSARPVSLQVSCAIA
jgi:hypothetical protein